MRLLFPLGLICITILVTIIMWISGNGFYITYIPAGTGDGIAQYSPLWIFALELVAAYGLFFRQLWGLVIIFALALALPIDIYPAWMILGQPDTSLIFHITVIALIWSTGIFAAVAYRYLSYE